MFDPTWPPLAEPGFVPRMLAAEVLSPAGYLRGLASVLGGTTTTRQPPEDPEDYHPEDDEPWTVIRDMPISAPLSWHRELADPP